MSKTLTKPLLGRYPVKIMGGNQGADNYRRIVEIEKQSQTNGWTIADFRKTIESHGVLGTVIFDEQDEKIIAYYVYEMEDNGINLLNFAVDPNYRRKGLGTAMMKLLKNRLHLRRSYLTANVRESNLQMQLFLKANQFLATKVEHNYYVDYDGRGNKKIEDAYCFSYPNLT